ncbi:MAG: amino acid ABC transporter permease [Cyanobacteria bacterium J06639_1]
MRDFSQYEILVALLRSARWTLALSAVAFTCGGIAGFLLMLLRISPFSPLRVVSRAYCELVQGTPLLIQFLLAFFGSSIFGLDLNPWTAATLALTTFSSAFLGDIWRGTVEAIPQAQWDGARALSLNYFQQLRLVILPQALRIAIPPTVGFLVQVIKGTSLASAIGFVELARSATNIANVTFEPFFVYALAAAIYFAICFPVTLASRKLEASLNH